jgi:4-hydroxy-tetrahydrodipicolinate synthase
MTCSTLYTALITPFLQNKVDLEGLALLIEKQKEANVPGLLILGSTAEAPSLSKNEKEEIYQLGRSLWSEKSLMVGCGALPTQAALEEIAHYPDADLLLIASPSYLRPTQDGLYQHFITLAEASTVPIILYNHPSRTGVNLEPETVLRLAAHPNIAGIKETHFSNLLPLTTHLRSQSEFSVMTGNDHEAYAGTLLGTKGTISTLSNLLPRDMLSLIEAGLEKNYGEGDLLYQELAPLMESLNCASNPIPLKAAMQHLELPSGSPRLPLTPLDEKFKHQLTHLLDQCLENSLSAF